MLGRAPSHFADEKRKAQREVDHLPKDTLLWLIPDSHQACLKRQPVLSKVPAGPSCGWRAEAAEAAVGRGVGTAMQVPAGQRPVQF